MLRGLSAEKRAIFTELTSLSMIAASFCLFYALILMVKNNIKQLVIRQMCMLIMQKECLCRFFNFVNFLTSDRDNSQPVPQRILEVMPVQAAIRKAHGKSSWKIESNNSGCILENGVQKPTAETSIK